MELTTLWFILIAVLWVGYFFLEGFDFGIGMLMPFIAKSENERRAMINTIAPVWDGNEVWLLTAGGAMFAAFPNWYATLFSGFYLPLLLILVALIIRGVAFEYRGKVDSPVWRKRWDLAIMFGSWTPPILWGVAFANIVSGLAINEKGDYTGGFFALLNPFGILGGIVVTVLCLLHGANYAALKTTGDMRERARKLGRILCAIAIVGGGTFLLWNQLENGKSWTWITTASAAVGLIGAHFAISAKKEGLSFILVAVALISAVVTLFGCLYPNVMPSTTDPLFSLTVENASSTPYTLKVMTVVALAMVPIVLIYQSWTYWVFRKRIGAESIPPVRTPL
ncbi:MAG TPA: cytochrome d ubiquinol oxidase subunit II [Acidimicrobiia bacterium]|nr:cytochrome d ubiquinol oxidase subunit II [Acidimicrobiia bacterium]